MFWGVSCSVRGWILEGAKVDVPSPLWSLQGGRKSFVGCSAPAGGFYWVSDHFPAHNPQDTVLTMRPLA